jgi:hypothetical protein
MDSNSTEDEIVFKFLSPTQVEDAAAETPIVSAIVLTKIERTLDLLVDMVGKNTQQQAQLRGQVVRMHDDLNDIKRALRER